MFHQLRQWQGQFKLINSFIRQVFPLVDQELLLWQDRVQECPDEVLSEQALASIAGKRFHAQGGSIYALYPGVETSLMVKFIVALQTISDYLDNLCDRAGSYDGNAFRHLHQALSDALTAPVGQAAAKRGSGYYDLYPHREDGGYLTELVQTCQRQIGKLPGYPAVEGQARQLAQLYADLQTYKHVRPAQREKLLTDWALSYLPKYPGLTCWEFAAATGSTLAIFMLAAAASKASLTTEEAVRITEAYFPWICGLHILLDYFIDQEEDEKEQDFNFVAYYAGGSVCLERLSLFWQTAKAKALALPNPEFHLTVIEGLLAMYLSDPKAGRGELAKISRELLQAAGPRVVFLHKLCRLLRLKGTI